MENDASAPTPKSLLFDSSLLGVVLSNVLSIGFALYFKWDLGEIMWVFWGQNVVIGVTNFIRMMRLKEFSTSGLKSGGRPVPETQKAKRQTAFFFLTVKKPLDFSAQQDIAFLLIAVGGVAATHGYSLFHNESSDFRHKKPNLGTLLFYPYMRVIPMHIAILAGAALDSNGAASGLVLVAFMIMKTFADAGMHMVEHYLFQRPE
jgi:hypothetical protein